MLSFRIAGQPQVEAKIQALSGLLDTRRILDEGASLLFNRMRTRFLEQVDPTGVRWVPSKAAEIRQKEGRGGGTLFDTGKLFRSLQLYAPDATSRAIGTNVTSLSGFPYPLVHQLGLAGFPQRQFLGFGDEDVQLMSDLVIKRVIEGLSK